MGQTMTKTAPATAETRREQRTMELRILSQDSEKKTMTIGGYAIRYDQPQTYNFGETTYTEIIRKGALDGADMDRVPLRYNHNDSIIVMARTKNSSLRLRVDEFGLPIEADLIDIQTNRDLYKCISGGLIDEMSFAFVVAPGGDKWTYEDDYKKITREIIKIEQIYDVSVVDEAFYKGTSVFARGTETILAEIEAKRASLLDLEKAKAFAIAKI